MPPAANFFRPTATDKKLLVRNITSGLTDNAVKLRQDVINETGDDVGTQNVLLALKENSFNTIAKRK